MRCPARDHRACVPPGPTGARTMDGFDMKVFVPVNDLLMERLGLTLEDLVPFDLEYEVLRPGVPFQVAETEAESTTEQA